MCAKAVLFFVIWGYMSGPERPGEIPPDLPPEYAEAYRRGYERARREGLDDEHAVAEAEHTVHFESVQPVILHHPEEEEPATGRGFLIPLLMGLGAVLLVAGAYWVGTLVADEVTPGTTDDGSNQALTEDGGEPQQKTATGKKYKGPVSAVRIGGAKATCQANDSVDAGGNSVSYEPRNVYDGDLTTAWRCPGNGRGERLTITLPRVVVLGEVGLVPGYAKTDARSDVDRYAQNNRITRVRWRFSDGTTVIQNIGGSASNRDMRTIRLPRPRADQVVIEVLASTPGEGRDTIAISEVYIGAARR